MNATPAKERHVAESKVTAVAHPGIRSNAENVARAKRAFTRRFGASVMPLQAKLYRDRQGARCVRVFDPETGSWAEYNVAWPRIHRVAEYDACNDPVPPGHGMTCGCDTCDAYFRGTP